MTVDKNEETELKEIFENAVKSTINLFREKNKLGFQLTFSDVMSLKRGPKGQGLILDTERKTDLIHLKHIFWDTILQLKSSSECISRIESSSIFNKILHTTVSIPHYHFHATPQEILGTFIETYLTNQVDLHFNEKQFTQTFEIMLKSIMDEFVSVETFIPIEQFNMDIECIELVDGWKIQRVSDERLGDLVPSEYRFGERSLDIGRIKFALVRVSKEKRIVFKNKRPKYEATEPIKPDIIMTALRILKKGFCSLGDWRIEPLDWFFSKRSHGLGFRSTNIMAPAWSRGYHLLIDEIDELIELIELFRSLAEKEALEVPISRFIYGIERNSGQDKLIDFMIALESLYLREDRELTLRFSLRVASFMGKVGMESGELFNLMKIAYSTRSKIVHGEKWKEIHKHLSKGRYTLSTLIDRIEEILRRSIIKFSKIVESGLSVDEIIERIDIDIALGTSFSKC